MLESYNFSRRPSLAGGGLGKQIPGRGVGRSHVDPPRQKQGQRLGVGTSLTCWHKSQETTGAGRHAGWGDQSFRTGSHLPHSGIVGPSAQARALKCKGMDFSQQEDTTQELSIH